MSKCPIVGNHVTAQLGLTLKVKTFNSILLKMWQDFNKTFSFRYQGWHRLEKSLNIDFL